MLGVADRTSRIDGVDEVLQRLIDSLQVLVLVLNGADSERSDPQRPNVTAAARQALEDALNLRRHFLGPEPERP
jgi:hypothetical protein